MRDPETAEYAERARGRGKSDREVMRCLKRYVAREAYRALMHPHEIRRPADASALVAARRAARVSQVRAASILGTSEKYISMLERGQRELKPIRRAYEAWVEAGLPLDWDRQAFEAERKMDSKKTPCQIGASGRKEAPQREARCGASLHVRGRSGEKPRHAPGSPVGVLDLVGLSTYRRPADQRWQQR